jgi:hypothetical protein
VDGDLDALPAGVAATAALAPGGYNCEFDALAACIGAAATLAPFERDLDTLAT